VSTHFGSSFYCVLTLLQNVGVVHWSLFFGIMYSLSMFSQIQWNHIVTKGHILLQWKWICYCCNDRMMGNKVYVTRKVWDQCVNSVKVVITCFPFNLNMHFFIFVCFVFHQWGYCVFDDFIMHIHVLNV